MNDKKDNPDVVSQSTFSLNGILKYALGSFFIIQIIGFFGVAIALAYPLWWFFLPQKTFCFYCLHFSFTNKAGFCPVCQRPARLIFNPPIRSVFVNVITILAFSLVSTVIVFAEVKVLFSKNSPLSTLLSSRRVSFYLPEKNKFKLGEDFKLEVKIKAADVPVNVVQADMQFDKSLFSVSKIETDKSFATIFTQKDYSNNEGWIRVVGGLPAPGYLGKEGLFARIVFTPKKSGIAQVQFMKTSKVLASDGRGSLVPHDFQNAEVLIEPKQGILGEEANKSLFEQIVNGINGIGERLGLFGKEK